MPDQDTLRLPLRRMSSTLSERIASTACCSPIWFAVFALIIDTIPKGMTVTAQSQLFNDQLGTDGYWITNGSMIAQSLLCAPALGILGYLSQPQRLGRKYCCIFASVISLLSIAIPAITLNAYTIVAGQTALAAFGVPGTNVALLVTLMSWTTDWCQPDEKLKYFGVLQGTLFGTFAFAPSLGKAIAGEDKQFLFTVALFLKLLSPLYLVLVFPRGVPGLRTQSTPALTRRFSMQSPVSSPRQDPEHGGDDATVGPSSANPRGSSAAVRVGDALKYLFTAHPTATFIYIMINFTDAAVGDNIMLWLIRERKFTTDMVNSLILMIGIVGAVSQSLGMPLAHYLNITPIWLLFVSVGCMVIHFCIYAFATSNMLIILLEPFGSFGYIATISSQAVISGTSAAVGPKDQGTLLGTLTGLQKLASCVGPLLLAGCNTAYKSFPAPLNWSGVGFACLAIAMLPPFFLAGVLSIRSCGNRSGHSETSSCVDSSGAGIPRGTATSVLDGAASMKSNGGSAH